MKNLTGSKNKTLVVIAAVLILFVCSAIVVFAEDTAPSGSDGQTEKTTQNTAPDNVGEAKDTSSPSENGEAKDASSPSENGDGSKATPDGTPSPDDEPDNGETTPEIPAGSQNNSNNADAGSHLDKSEGYSESKDLNEPINSLRSGTPANSAAAGSAAQTVVDPADPAAPYRPNNPSEGQEPDNPEKPVGPDDPEKPVEPDNPEEPEEPEPTEPDGDDPDNPNTPQHPGPGGGNPYIPVNPWKPIIIPIHRTPIVNVVDHTSGLDMTYIPGKDGRVVIDGLLTPLDTGGAASETITMFVGLRKYSFTIYSDGTIRGTLPKGFKIFRGTIIITGVHRDMYIRIVDHSALSSISTDPEFHEPAFVEPISIKPVTPKDTVPVTIPQTKPKAVKKAEERSAPVTTGVTTQVRDNQTPGHPTRGSNDYQSHESNSYPARGSRRYQTRSYSLPGLPFDTVEAAVTEDAEAKAKAEAFAKAKADAAKSNTIVYPHATYDPDSDASVLGKSSKPTPFHSVNFLLISMVVIIFAAGGAVFLPQIFKKV